MTDDTDDEDSPIKLPTFAELRAILANRPPGDEGVEIVDTCLDLFADDLSERWPQAPAGVAFTYAAGLVAKALELGGPKDDDGGGCSPRQPSPTPAPAVLTA